MNEAAKDARPDRGTISGHPRRPSVTSRRLGALYGSFVLLLLGGCGGGAGPEDVTRRYFDALAKGDADRAFGDLSAGTRARLASGEAAWRSGSANDALVPATAFVPVDGEAAPGLRLFRRLVLGQGGGALPLPADGAARVGAAVTVGDRARVAVAAPGGTKELSLVRESGGWRLVLDLPPP